MHHLNSRMNGEGEGLLWKADHALENGKTELADLNGLGSLKGSCTAVLLLSDMMTLDNSIATCAFLKRHKHMSTR